MKKYFICLLGLVAVMLAGCNRNPSLQEQLQEYVDSCPAEIGIAVIIQNKDTIVVNDGRYPMNSVLKLYQALPSAESLNNRHAELTDTLVFRADELQKDTWSPMLKDHKETESVLTWEILFEYALCESDNNASDLLITNAAAIKYIVDYWNSKGIKDFDIKWTEAQMHEDPQRSNENWTTPLAAACVINYTVPYSMYSSNFTMSQVGGYLMRCKTGENRISKPLIATNAIVAHKTGTGFDDMNGNPTGINDVAYVILPNGTSYSLAVFFKKSDVGLEETEAMIAHISEIVWNYLKKSDK